MHIGPVIMGLFTLGLGVVGWLIIEFAQHRNLLQLLAGQKSIPVQILVGSAYGFMVGGLATLLFRLSFMRSVVEKNISFIPVEWSLAHFIFLSFCAGVGEEILFRGALQHWFGIVVTTIGFVVVHGYLNPRNWRLSVYGVYLLATLLPVAYMAEIFGLTAPIFAHAFQNMVFYLFVRSYRRSSANVQTGGGN